MIFSFLPGYSAACGVWKRMEIYHKDVAREDSLGMQSANQN